jgi:rhodanese-related sulfurtransferase
MYLVYCHVDSVAIQGAQKLVDAGFIHVYRLEGNYAAWVDAGYPVET